MREFFYTWIFSIYSKKRIVYALFNKQLCETKNQI